MSIITPADFEQYLRNVRKELCSRLQYCKDCQHYIPGFDHLSPLGGLCGKRCKETTDFGGTACSHFTPIH